MVIPFRIKRIDIIIAKFRPNAVSKHLKMLILDFGY